MKVSTSQPLPGAENRRPPQSDIVVVPDGTVEWSGRKFPCALGRAGVIDRKREGDGATPVGCFALRRVLYRPDRVPRPVTVLPLDSLHPLDAWCDDPNDPRYNQLVRQPYAASVELLWRDDHIYDIIVVLGFNDEPVERSGGSAVFLHIARPDYTPTQGCVAVSRANLSRILEQCEASSRLCVKPR